MRIRVESEMLEVLCGNVGGNGLVVNHALGNSEDPGSCGPQWKLIRWNRLDGLVKVNDVDSTGSGLSDLVLLPCGATGSSEFHVDSDCKLRIPRSVNSSW